MQTKKSRVFTKKLIALFLAVLMALSCFTGALTAFAASVESDKRYTDENLAANFLTWAETTDEQTAEALLDYADLYIGDLLSGLLGTDHVYFSQNVVLTTIKIDGYLDSVDGLYDIIRQADGILSSYGGIVGGDVKNIDLSPIADLKYATSGDYVVSRCGKSYRQVNSAKEMIMALAQTLYKNSNDFSGKNVIGQFFKGKLSLGSIIEGAIGGDVYSLLKDSLGMWDGYQSDLVYNIVANLILKNTKWFDEDTTEDYYAQLKANKRTSFVFDDILFDALNRELLQKISVLVTYPTFTTDEKGNSINESSYTRKRDNKVQNNKLVYSDEFVDKNNVPKNVYLFQYDFNGDGKIENVDGQEMEKLEISQNDTLFGFAFKALKFAWNTVLQDTLGLVHVNYDTDRGHGTNFDNVFFYWMTDNKKWNSNDWASNYSETNVKAWADAVYADYDAKNADEFIGWVKHTLDYDRNVKADATNTWKDIDATQLFAKLRYSPLADKYFDMQTGPINLYFMQTGIDAMTKFFNTAFTTYDNMVAGLNDALVAVTKVIFMNSDNIGFGSQGKEDSRKPAEALSVPEMKTTGNTIDKSTIASTLVGNFMDMFEYAANAADANILNAFYTNNSITSNANNLSESNFEEAMIPLLVTCINQITMLDPVHDERWDSCVDAEGVAIVALEEYLSYVLPDKDYTPLWTIDEDGKMVANKGENLFDNAVLPMCRDAVSYFVQALIPCRDKNGNEWNVYERDVKDDTTLLDILNSVIVYYASTDGYGTTTTNANGVKINNAGKAVAALLGVVNGDGTNLINKENTIWQNIDAVANKILPILGTFQYGTTDKAGQFDSEELIWEDLVAGILNIGDTRASGKQGITNLIEKIITIITADPIANNSGKGSLVVMIYDVLADEINAILGARYTGQGYTKVVPNAEWYDRDSYDTTKSTSPFDSLLTVGTIGYYSATANAQGANGDGYSTGIIGILICNIYEIFGGTGYTTQANNSKVWTGAMFAVEAVNNFIPSFVPQLSDHTFNAATAKVLDPSQNGKTAGAAFDTTTLVITNNARGINRFYNDANGNVAELDRYFIDVTDITVKDQNGNSVNNVNVAKTATIAPDKAARLEVSGTCPSASTTYQFNITYDVYLAKNGESKTSENAKLTNLKTTAYMYISPEVDWQQRVYPGGSRVNDNGVKYFASDLEPGAGKTTEYTASTAASNSMYATFPKDFIVKMSKPEDISENGIRVVNTTNSTFGSPKSFDGVITYIQGGTSYYPVSGGTVSETLTTQVTNNADVGYAAIDAKTGNILNYEFYDYSIDDGKTFIRKDEDGLTYGKHGYTADEISEIKTKLEASNPDASFVTRPHVVLTLQEALSSGLVYGVKRTPAAADENGNVTYIYDAVFINLKSTAATVTPSGAGESVNTLLCKGYGCQDSISWGTPTPGLYLAAGKQTIAKGKSAYTKFMVYDGTTKLSADSYEMPTAIWRTSNPLTYTIKVKICDDSDTNTLNNAYNKSLKAIASYRDTDLADYDGSTSSAFVEMQNSLANAVATMGLPINPSNAGTIGSEMETIAKTNSTTRQTNKDIAYMPISTSVGLPASLQLSATKGGDGYWYANKECTLPIYSTTEVTDSDVTNGKTIVGDEVVKSEEDGKWHLVNAPKYEQDWDTTTYTSPYLYDTTIQSTVVDGEVTKNLYKEINFVYRDAKGEKCTSGDNWAYKLADSQEIIKPNSNGVEYRGMYQRSIDSLTYYYAQLRDNIKSEYAMDIVTDVMEDRVGLNNVNYEIASYEKMVQIAKVAEKLIDTKWTATEEVDEDGNVVYEPEYSTTASSLEVELAKELYQQYKGYVIDRGYIGDKLEKEIKCATGGYDYSALKANIPEVAEGEVAPASTVTSTSATDAKYGAWVDGALVNEGDVVYTEASWTNYINALATAVETATEKTDHVSNVYTVKCALANAENELEEEPSNDTITVSGKIVIAGDSQGNATGTGIIGINVMVGDEIVATSAADGSFTAQVPAGTTELKIAGDTTVDRTVTLSGTANVENAIIPIVICDYNHDGYVNPIDVGWFSGYLNGDDYFVYADLNADGFVNPIDVGWLFVYLGSPVEYAPIALD